MRCLYFKITAWFVPRIKTVAEVKLVFVLLYIISKSPAGEFDAPKHCKIDWFYLLSVNSGFRDLKISDQDRYVRNQMNKFITIKL